jgi:hypothetical protein
VARGAAGSVGGSGERNLMSNVPWDDVGKHLGDTLVRDALALSRQIAESLRTNPQEGVPDFQSAHWQYEFCIFDMFWVWYIANSPRLQAQGATVPLLDSFVPRAQMRFIDAGLLLRSDASRWNNDLQERFIAYKGAYESSSGQDASLRIYSGTVGWMFARYLFPGKDPNPGLVMIINQLGGLRFTSLAQYVERLERTHKEEGTRHEFPNEPVSPLAVVIDSCLRRSRSG